MRRMIILGLSLVLFGAAAGCHHVAGICDCEGPRQPCMQGESSLTREGTPPVLHAEPIKESPKVLDK
jgi:hypothetical protein